MATTKATNSNNYSNQTKFKIKLLAHLWKTFFFVQMKIHQKKKKEKKSNQQKFKIPFFGSYNFDGYYINNKTHKGKL